MKNVVIIAIALVCLVAVNPASAESAPTPSKPANPTSADLSWTGEPISFGQFTEATGASAGEFSLRGCNTAYQYCMAGCQIQCQNHPFPPACLAPCEQACRINLAACVSIVITVGVLI